jgi:phosphotransferase system HPr-like phosphotransfer protein
MSVVITAVDPLGTGFLRGNSAPLIFVEPTLPTATLLNYSSALNASVGIDLPICSSYTGGIVLLCSGAFVLGSFTKATHVVIDIVGYHARPVYAIVDDVGSFRKQIGFASVVTTASGDYTVTALDNLSGCVVTPAISSSDTNDGVSAGLSIVADAGYTDGRIFVKIRNSSGTAVNEDFTLTVTC